MLVGPARPGDRWLLCSDGLSDYVEQATIASALADPRTDGAVGALVAAALEAGAPDNVTCVVADVVRSPAAGTGLDRARRTPRSQLLGAAAELDPWGTPATGGSVPAGQAATSDAS